MNETTINHNLNPNKHIIYKCPKGCLDLCGPTYDKMKFYKNYLENIFEENGGIGLETPVFELKNVLLNKYETDTDNPMIFDLSHFGSADSESYSLRYDLTVPFSRWLIQTQTKKIRRYSIAKSYRIDQPSAGRYREFYQADFDIVGESSTSMISEYTLLQMAINFLENFNIYDYKILINSTHNLKEFLMSKLNISEDNFKNICQTIDKLDKYDFDNLIPEFEQKGIQTSDIEIMHNFVNSTEPVDQVSNDDFIKLKTYLNFNSKLKWTNSLARGLDYYNGLIFEIKLDNNPQTIISGGRYDNLVPDLTMIGISFGLSRLIDYLPYETPVWKNLYYLTTVGNISTEDMINTKKQIEIKIGQNIIIDLEKQKLIKTITKCINNSYKFIIILAENEFKSNQYILKDLETSTQTIHNIN